MTKITKNIGVFDKSDNCLNLSSHTGLFSVMSHEVYAIEAPELHTCSWAHIYPVFTWSDLVEMRNLSLKYSWCGFNPQAGKKTLIPPSVKLSVSTICVWGLLIFKGVCVRFCATLHGSMCVWTPPHPLFLSAEIWVWRHMWDALGGEQQLVHNLCSPLHFEACTRSSVALTGLRNPCWLELNAAPPPARLRTASCDA